MTRDQFQKDVRLWLSPPDPSTNHRIVWKEHHEGTSAWFFQSGVLADWVSSGSLLWIHGKPGCGKSTLLSAIIQDIARKPAAGLAGMAYYYFDFRDIKKQDRYGLLSSLLSQLSARSDPCYEVLSQLYSGNAGGAEKPDGGVLTKCIKDMLCLPGQGPIYIVIDALDECPDTSDIPSAREEVLELIEELTSLNRPNVRLCVASRPEIEIRNALEHLKPLEISLHGEDGQKNDIIEYIKSVVHSDRGMRNWREEDKQLVIDTLSDKADGMFRWVVCQIDSLRRNFPVSIRSILERLPESLDETYTRILLSIDKEKQEYTQRLLRCLTASIRPLRVEELAEILAIRFDEAGFPTFNPDWRPFDANAAVLSACSSLISVVDISGSQIVQFAHFSVKEFLTSPRLVSAENKHLKSISRYHILPELAHATLARACLGVLLHLDDKIDRNSIRHFPLAQYAARFWLDHARFGNVSSQVQDVMEHLFDPTKPHFAAWVWLYDVDHHWLDPMSEMHPTLPSAVPLYYASLCGFLGLVEHFVAARPQDINARGGFHNTPLCAASAKGKSGIVQLLLNNNADPNLRGHEGWAPLHSASLEGHIEIARILLDSGVDVDQQTDDGWAPLLLASTYGKLDVANFLIQRGAVIDICNSSQNTPLYQAAANGKPDIARLLLNHRASVNVTSKNTKTPLHVAADMGYHEIVELLLGFGARPHARTKAQETPLALACRNRRLEASQLLLERGSDANSRDKDRRTPLHYASDNGHLDLTRLLLEHDAHVNAHDSDCRTPLHYASANGHLDIVKVLIDHGANVDGHTDDSEQPEETPLDRQDSASWLRVLWFNVSWFTALWFPWLNVSWLGHVDASRPSIEHGTVVSSSDDRGLTPFHLASRSGKLQVVEFLLQRGVEVDIRDANGGTSLKLASSTGKLDVVRFLIEKGADIHTKDNNGSNPLHIASQNGHVDVVQLLIDCGTAVDIRNGPQMTPLALASGEGKIDVFLLLIERGADLNARDNKSWAPLHFASRFGRVDTTQLLLDRHVDPNIQADDLLTPLHLASAHGHIEVAQLLVQRGAAIDVSDSGQQTPLDRAAANGSADVVRLLIGHGANLHATDVNGCTPLHAASRSGHLEVVKLLLEKGADVDQLDKANKTAANLASKYNKAKVASFLAKYKADENVRNNIRSATSTDLGAQEIREDEKPISLQIACEEGKLDVIKSLLDRGADVNSCISYDTTILHRAATNGDVKIVCLLLEQGAVVDPRDRLGWTPLHWASRNGYVEVSRMLLDYGANVNAQKVNYWTPLHSAAHNGFLELATLLLERGADINVLSDKGQTPYQLSRQQKHQKVVDLLRNLGPVDSE